MTVRAATALSFTSVLGTVAKTADTLTNTVDIVANGATMANNWVKKHMDIQATDHALELGTHEKRSVARLGQQLADEARAIEKKSTDKKWLEHFDKYSAELQAILDARKTA